MEHEVDDNVLLDGEEPQQPDKPVHDESNANFISDKALAVNALGYAKQSTVFCANKIYNDWEVFQTKKIAATNTRIANTNIREEITRALCPFLLPRVNSLNAKWVLLWTC